MRISDGSSDVCSSDLAVDGRIDSRLVEVGLRGCQLRAGLQHLRFGGANTRHGTAVIRSPCVKLRFGRNLAARQFIDLLEPRQIRLRLRYGRLSLSNACFCCSQSRPALIDGIDQAGSVEARKDLPFGDTVIHVDMDVRDRKSTRLNSSH